MPDLIIKIPRSCRTSPFVLLPLFLLCFLSDVCRKVLLEWIPEPFATPSLLFCLSSSAFCLAMKRLLIFFNSSSSMFSSPWACHCFSMASRFTPYFSRTSLSSISSLPPSLVNMYVSSLGSFSKSCICIFLLSVVSSASFNL